MEITLYPKYLLRRLFVHGRHDFFKAGYRLLYPEYSRHGMTPWQHYVIDGSRKGYDNGNHPPARVFFPEGYLLEYPDVKDAKYDPWRHYAEKGRKEGRDNGMHPNTAQFFAEGYLEMYPDVKAAGVNPWYHYVLDGKKEGRDNGLHPDSKKQFFAGGYLEMYPAVKDVGADPWHHYVLSGKKEGRDNGLHPKSTLFFPAGYLEMYPDVKATGADPWRHYVMHGKKEGRDNGLHPHWKKQFFAAGYLEMYPDVKAAGLDPWRHYVLKGKKEGRDNGLHPSKDLFFPAGYLEMYPDVRAAGVDPWQHYVLNGKKEGRDNGFHPKDGQFFADGYRCNYPQCDNEPYGSNLWINYIKIGKPAKRNNGLLPDRPFFNGGYLERHPGSTVAEAWKDYVMTSLANPDTDMNLYQEGNVMREILHKKNPSVAVIMPVYNRKNVVMQAISSVLRQSWANWHLYVVDDFSNDGTYKYLRSVISDPRIFLLKSKSKGVCGARNTAIAKLQNEDYVAYLDSDNTWNRQYLELMLCRLLDTNTNCCYGVQKLFRRQDDGTDKTISFRYDEFDVLKLRHQNFIDLNVFMHRAGVFNQVGFFDESLRRGVDWDFIVRCAEKYSFSRLPYVGCNYNDTEDEHRITQKNSFTGRYGEVIHNKCWIDWDFLSENAGKCDKSLVSVIVYYERNDSLAFLQNCLNSLKNASKFAHSKYRTQVILVDNSGTEEGHAAASRYSKESLVDKYLINEVVIPVSLSCNRVLSLVDGFYIVYLNCNSYVSLNWLDPLIDPLRRHHELKGTTSKVLQPDGAINSIGCLFDSVSGFPYDVLHELPSNFHAAERITLLPSTNSYCSAFRFSDVISKKGQYCLYVSELSISDLCLQLGDGKSRFAYIPSSRVICPADTHQHTARTNDLEAFAERWFGKGVYSEQKYFARRNLDQYQKSRKTVCSVSFKKYSRTACIKCATKYNVPVYDFSRLGCSCELSSGFKNMIRRMKSFTRLVVIKDPAPGKRYDTKYEWGDYYYARSLARAFERLGFDTRIDCSDEWYGHDDGVCINIVLRGCVRFDCSRYPESLNVMWLISHPDMTDDGELNEYGFIFAASEILARQYSRQSVYVPCAYLPQCTDPAVFSPSPASAAYSHGNLLLGNSRGVLRDSVKKCINEGVKIEIIGNGWDKLVKKEFISSNAVPSFLVPFLYRSADTVLNDHWEDMRQNGIVSNRIFDVLACGCGIVTDNFQSIPEELKFACFSYENCSIREAIEKCKKFNASLTNEQKQELYGIIRDRHSFARRALQILEALYPIIQKKSGRQSASVKD